MKNKSKTIKRQMRHRRIRSQVIGTKEKPRVSVFKSNKHIFVQFVDDTAGKTIISSEVISKAKSKLKGKKSEVAAKMGELLAEKAKVAGLKEIVFDRGGYKYHGRVKALADGLRKGGVKF